MKTLSEQIVQATNDFVATVQQLTEQHAALVLQETFSSLGDNKQRATAPAAAAPTLTTTAPRSRGGKGAKRGVDELEHLAQRFVQFVQANPGLRIEQINKQLGTKTAALALPIRKLIAERQITTKGQKRSTTYFAGKTAGTSTGASATPSEGESTGEEKPAGKSRKRSSKSRPRSRSRSKK